MSTSSKKATTPSFVASTRGAKTPATSRLGTNGKTKLAAAGDLGGLSEAEVKDRMLAKLATSALTPEDAQIMGLIPTTRAGARRRGLPSATECFIIPYFLLNGKPSKFFRARFVEDTRKGFDKLAGRKALRYAQPVDSVTEAYLPPLDVNWASIAKTPVVPIVITEGELKAACACKHGHPTIGLGGVWSFMSKRHEVAMLPIFDEFDFKDREVFICFDSDAATNPDVVMAERKLAQRLLDLGAEVRIVRLKAAEDGGKMGLDDFIVINGADAFNTMLDEALAYAGSEMLHELNERVIYVRNPGLIWDHKEQMRIAPQSFTGHAYSDWVYTEFKELKNGSTQVTEIQAAIKWLKWPQRSTVSRIDYSPGEDDITQDGALNVWPGWGLPYPMEGDVSPWHELMDHIFAEEHESRRWFEQWLAYPLQHPGAKMATAAAIWGPVHGSGKTLIGHTLMRIYGRNAAEVKDTDLEDERNEWAENKQFVLADDITSRGDRKFMRRLMTMVTQKTMRLNPKYIPSYSVSDRINYLFTSNDPDALFMDDQDRRFFVHEVRAGKFINYRVYVAWRDSDSGAAALWHYLLNVDTKGFDPQAPAPMTAGKESMIELGKSDLGSWILELKQNTEAVLRKAGLRGDIFTANELHMAYDPMGDKRASTNALARELKRAGFIVAGGEASKLKRPDGSTFRAYAVRNTHHWERANWKMACDHYTENHPELAKPPVGKKF